MKSVIPFTKPFMTGSELNYIAEAINTRRLAADGYFTQRCSEILSKTFNISKVLMTPSGTAALELALLLCDLSPDDEVILPSFTFASSANAVLRAGAKPVFLDIRPDTLNLDENRLEAAITPKTKAIMVVHYAGTACEMGRILKIAKKYNLRVIEDAAQAVNSFYEGQALGSLGDLAAFSFHHTKNYICGEGGAACINDPTLIERAEILREKGTNRNQFLKGQIEKYTWVDSGSSYLPPEISCAFLYAQLEKLEWISMRRREIYERYRDHLQPLADSGIISLPLIPEACVSNYHIFYVLLPNFEVRERLMSYLKENGIETAFHYVPLHSSPMGEKLGYQPNDLPVTENLSLRLLRFPLYPELTEEEQLRIMHYVNVYCTSLGPRFN